MPNPWFRFYSEALRDRKIERIARVTKQPKALILGVWVTLLSLANDSPQPGALLLTEDIPLVLDDLALETDVDGQLLTTIIERFEAMQMLVIEGGIYCITNWDKRQFKSDSSAERVRRFRERQAAAEASDGNDDVTFPVTDSSVSVSVSESASEEVQTFEKTNGPTYSSIRERWAELFPTRPHPTEKNKTLRAKAIVRLKDDDFRENWADALLRMTHADPWVLEKTWFTLNWFLANDENWQKCRDGNYDGKVAPAPRPPPRTGIKKVWDKPTETWVEREVIL